MGSLPSSRTRKGRLIAFEGLDGAGKTTVINQCLDELNKRGLNAALVLTHGRYPEYWMPYEDVRKQMMARGRPIQEEEDQILRAAEFVSYAVTDISASLDKYDVVITDRYALGKYVLAKALSLQSTPTAAEMFLAAVEGGVIPMPDVTIYLRIAPEAAYERIVARGAVLEVKEELNNLKKAYHLFEDSVSSSIFQGIQVVDAGAAFDDVVKASLGKII